MTSIHSTASRREMYVSPPRYRRHTTGLVNYYPHSMPNSARLSSTPRPASALDRRMVHKSYGDLTMDIDLQSSHPRLQTDFYQDLYKKYPHAFRRRLEAREAGRRLFNSKPQVRFKEEIEVSDAYHSSTNTHLDHPSANKHLTNWDREVGHFLQHKSGSRECITSLEPSECSGSVLSVTQRLRMNSQHLNKLLNESSPLRRHRERATVQYDSGTENEQTLQDYMLEKSKERSRNRKRQQRIIIQRKINNKQENGDGNKENELRTRRWVSKSASPTARHRLKYRIQVMSLPIDNHDVNIDSLMADSDLKIDTVLEKISSQMVSPDSPPDSAIDIETPSVRSLVTLETRRTGNSKKLDSLSQESPPFYEKQQLQDEERTADGVESSPGSSASACVRKNLNKQTENNRNESVNSNGAIEMETAGESTSVTPAVANGAQNTQEINDNSSETVDGFTHETKTEFMENECVSSGLLQLYSEEMGYTNTSNDRCNFENTLTGTQSMQDNQQHVINTSAKGAEHDNKIPGQTDENYIDLTGESSERHVSLNSDANDLGNELDTHVNKSMAVSTGANCRNKEFGENLSYQADDEGDIDEMVTMETVVGSKMKKRPVPRDSDVDSGIGPCSTCTDTLPPLGKSTPRQTTMKSQPVRADHSIFPSRSDVDVDILDEVNLVHLSHDLNKKGANSTIDKTDETNIRFGTFRQSGREKKVAEKYRKARSPSPYVLLQRGPSPGLRPKSAPTFAKSEIDLRVVDISLSNESLTDLSSNVSSMERSGSRSLPNGDVPRHNTGTKPKTRAMSNPSYYQSNDIKMKYASTPNLYSSEVNRPLSNQCYESQNHQSSSDAHYEQRKHSITSVSSKESSMSPISDSETDTTTQIRNTNYHNAMEGTEKYVENNHRYRKNGKVNGNLHKVIYSHGESSRQYLNDVNDNMEGLPNGETTIAAKKGVYKPSVTSPRVKEKRLKLRNILKHKKGSFSPSEEGESRTPRDERGVVNRIYAKDRGVNMSDGSMNSSGGGRKVSGTSSNSSGSAFNDNVQESHGRKLSLEYMHHGKDLREDVNMRNSPVVKEMDSASGGSMGSDLGSHTDDRLRKISVESDTSRRSPYSGISERYADTESIDHFIAGDNVTTVKAKPVILERTDYENVQNRASRTLPRTPDLEDGKVKTSVSPPKAQPPKKPARTKNKNLPADLNFSKYKIKPVDNGETGGRISPPLSASSSDMNSQSDLRFSSHDQREEANLSTEATCVAVVKQPEANIPIRETGDNIEVMPVERINRSNLAKSKEISASKSSLFDKTKGKFKKFRKAMSLERGIDNCGVEDHSGPNHQQGDNSSMPKVRKAPSLKSITSLFKRKKKKGKFHIEDSDSSHHGSSLTINSGGSAPLTGDKRKQWSSCHTLSPVDTPTTMTQPITGQTNNNRPIGKLKKVNADGTQLIQLIKPEDGPIGFFIAKGNAKYGNGIFVSRFSSTRPGTSFAGLLGVGDEIIEVNGHLVRDLSQDAVYNLISASPLVVMKIFPFIARKDV